MAVEKIENYNIHQNPATNENQFDIENYLNENWNKTKEVVNNNADELIDIQGKISDLETDNTSNKQDISEIKQEQQTQNANIEKLKQEDIDIKKELERTKKEFDDYAIHGQASGEFIHLTDSAKSSCKVDLKGNTKQETRTGKNLFNIETATMYAGTKELTSDKTGFILRKSTNRVNNYYLTKNLPAGTYTIYFKLKLENSTFNQQNVGFSFKNSAQDNVGATVTATSNGTYALKVTTDQEVSFLYCFINNGENANCVATITDFMILEGEHTIDENYERFGASPSLNHPSKIETVGNNINLLHMQEKSYIQLGVNVTQKESCLELNGTTNGAQNILSGGYVDIGNFKKGKYIFKAHISGSFEKQGSDDFALYIRKKNDTSKSYGNISGANIEEGTNSFIFELTEDTDLVIQIWVNASGIVFSNFEMKLKIEEGEIATSHSPYNLGSVKIIVINENLYNEDNYADKLTIDTDETFKETSSTKIIKIPVKPNSTYTLSRSPVEGTTANIVYGISDTEPLANAKCTYNILHSTETNKQIVTTANTKYICIRKQKNNSDYALFENMKVEENEVATSYIEHEENSVTVPIQQEMLEEDYIDKENKKEVHNWLTVTLDGVQNIARYKHKTIENEERSFFQFNITGKGNGFSGGADSIYCDKLKAFEGAANNAINQECIWNEEGQYFYISINKSRLETDDTEGMNKFLQENPMQVYCTRAETLELDLTQEQIEALEKLDEMQTYKNITNITTDSIAILDVDYKKDLETWQKQQDDRITALEELLSTTQTSAMLIENLENDLLKEVE